MLHQYIKSFFQKFYLVLLSFLFLSIIYSVIAFNSLAAFNNVLSGQIWQGYYTVLVKKELTTDSVLKKLDSLHAISKQTVRFKVNDFDSYREVALKNLDEQFESIDPRLDPYIKSINSFFEVDKDWDIVYVPAGWPLFLLDLKLRTILGDNRQDWIILDDASLHNKLINVVLGCAFFIAIFLLKRKRNYPVLALLGFLPWLVVLKTGDPFMLFAFYLLYPGYAFIIERLLEYIKQKYLCLDSNENNRSVDSVGKATTAKPDFYHPYLENIKLTAYYLAGAFFLVLLLWVILAILSHALNPDILKLFLPLVAGLLLPALYGTGFLLKQKYQEHQTFLDVPIRRPELGSFFKKIYFIPLCLLMVFTPFFFYTKINLPSLPIPYPVAVNGLNTISLQSLANLWQMRDKADLPDLATYLVHCFFQEGLMYGLDYNFPVPERKLAITSYKEDETTGKIEAVKKVIKKFDNSWLNEQLARPAQNGIEQILIKQQRPVRVVKKAGSAIVIHYPFWLYAICLTFLFISVFLITPGRQIFRYVFILNRGLQTKIATVKIHADFLSRLQNLVWIKKERKKCS